jgi:hypothetical protein
VQKELTAQFCAHRRAQLDRKSVRIKTKSVVKQEKRTFGASFGTVEASLSV